jgi:acyl-CoA hydrolase
VSAEDVTVTKPPAIGAALSKKRRSPEAVVEHITEGDDLITGMGNSEPATVLDALEAHAERLSRVRIHQMLPFRGRRYMHGHFPGLRHVSWFLSPADREAFHKATCDLVPNSFSEVPSLMRRSTRWSLVLASVSPPDRHGYFSLGTHADYAAALIGEAPFFVEVNHRMPRTFGENQVHLSQVVGWCEADYPLAELPHRPARDIDHLITEYGVAELRGSSIRERTRKLISIAHPKFRDELQRQAREMGYSKPLDADSGSVKRYCR